MGRDWVELIVLQNQRSENHPRHSGGRSPEKTEKIKPPPDFWHDICPNKVWHDISFGMKVYSLQFGTPLI